MIVLDTHAIIWDALSPGRLSKKAKKAISRANEADGIIFCDISLWEIAMLVEKKRIKIDVDYQDFIDLVLSSNRYIIQRITTEIAGLSVILPETINKDPADRIIAATSIIHSAPLVTADENLIKAKEISTIW